MSDSSGDNPFAPPEGEPTPPAGSSGPASPTPPYGAGPAQPYGTTPTQPYGPAPTPPAGPAAPPSYGAPSAPPYGAAPTPLQGGAPPQPYDANPPRYGTPSAPPYPPAPSPSHGAPSAQPYGAPSAPPYGAPSYGAAASSGPPSAPPYGAGALPGAPGQPYGSGYGYPPAGQYPGTYPTAYPAYTPAPQGTDPMAIAALATSIAGPIVTAGLAAPVGLGLGIAGLVRTRRSGRPGKGMSIAAIVISSFVILLGIGLLVLVVIAAQNGDFDEATDGAAGHYTLRGDLTAGTCLDVYPETYPMDDARVVDCATAHGAEVVAQTTLPGPVELDDEDQPTGTVFDAALDECESAIVALAPEAADAGVADVYFSDPDRWPTQASAYCVLASRDADLHGSVVAHDLVGSSLSS